MAIYTPPLWITHNLLPKSCRAIHGTVRLPWIPSALDHTRKYYTCFAEEENRRSVRFKWPEVVLKSWVEPDKPHCFSCWVALLSSGLSIDLRFWTRRIHVLMVIVCMHTETIWLSDGLNEAFWASVKCQKDWCCYGTAALRSYRFPDDCIGSKIRSLASVNAAWGSRVGCVCNCSPAGAFNQPGECLHLELFSGFLSNSVLLEQYPIQHLP